MSNIASLREQLKWSREKLARKVDLSLGSVLNVEHGSEFNSTTVRAFASGLGIPLEKAFALCASIMGDTELRALAAVILGGKSHDRTKGLSDPARGKNPPPQEKAGRTRARTPRVAVND